MSRPSLPHPPHPPPPRPDRLSDRPKKPARRRRWRKPGDFRAASLVKLSRAGEGCGRVRRFSPAAVSSSQPLAACDSRMSEQSETRLIDRRTGGRTDGGGGGGWEIAGGGVCAGVVPVGVFRPTWSRSYLRKCVAASTRSPQLHPRRCCEGLS